MSAAYRITTEHNPTDSNVYFETEWEARIFRTDDGEFIGVTAAKTEAEALTKASEYIARLNTKGAGRVLFADESGQLLDQPTPEPASLRVVAEPTDAA